MLGSTMDKELKRQKLEEHISEAEKSLINADLDLRGVMHSSPLENGDFPQDKYVRYRLLKVSPEEDADLYRILELLMNDVYWYPSSYQESVEENVFSDIYREMELFLEDEPNTFHLASGEVLLYFAQHLSDDCGITFAMACEMLLGNCNISLSETDTDILLQKYHNAILCDQVEVFKERLFTGPDTEDLINSSVNRWCNGHPVMPTWEEQYQQYVTNLMQNYPVE